MAEARALSQKAQFLRFILVGLSSTGLYFGLLALLDGVIASVMVLAAICYAVSMGANYVVQGRFTFQGAGQQDGIARSLRRFIVMHLTALVANSLAMAGLVTSLGLPLFGSQITVTAVLAVSTYLVSKHWVFRATEADTPQGNAQPVGSTSERR